MRSAPSALTLHRTVDDPSEVLAGRAEVADHLPDGIRRDVNCNCAGGMGHFVALLARKEDA